MKIRSILLGIVGLILIASIFGSSGQYTSTFDKEIKYYQRKTGYTIDETYTWIEFQTADGVFTQVSRVPLREESSKVFDRMKQELGQGVCRIYVDRDAKTLWVSGVGPDSQQRYVYWWSP